MTDQGANGPWYCQDSPGDLFAAAVKLKALVKADLKFLED